MKVQGDIFADQPRHRYTMDGRACAQKFQMDGKVYTDCTADKNPDGKMEDHEWCYVAPGQGGDRNWDFCRQVLDYDKVREKVKDIYNELIIKTRQVTQELQSKIGPAKKSIYEVSLIREQQQKVDKQLNDAQIAIKLVSDNWKTLQSLKQKWDQLQLDVDKITHDVNELEAREKMNQELKLNVCEGMLGYENEEQGNGLDGYYYNNEDFTGTPVRRIDKNIDLYLNQEEPIEGVNFENFSIRWLGWLNIPKTSSYIFYARAEDGCQVKLNGEIIINKGLSETRTWLDADNGKGEHESQPMELQGGYKYRIEFKMFHSIHNNKEEDGISYTQLFWSSKEFSKRIIEKDYLFTKYTVPNAKISRFSPDAMELTAINENENAFKNKDDYKIQDVPLIFQGHAMLRMNKGFNNNTLNWENTAQIVVYVAIDADEPNYYNPLTPDFTDTLEEMTILKIAKKPVVKPMHLIGIDSAIIAIESRRYKIFKKKFEKGPNMISFKFSKEHNFVDMLFFYNADPNSKPLESCGGPRQLISLVHGGGGFSNCTQSTKFPGDGWDCHSAFSGLMKDNAAGMWQSDHQGVGSWILLKLKKNYMITDVEIKNRDKDYERNAAIEISFGESDFYSRNNQIVNLKNLDKKQHYMIDKRVVTNQVKFTITQTYSQRNNGNSINVYGIPCSDVADPELYKDDPDPNQGRTEIQKLYKVTCSDTIINNDNLLGANLRKGDGLDMECTQLCESKDQYDIFGNQVYTSDSSICRAAIHSGVLPEGRGKFRMNIEECPVIFKSTIRDKIQSNSRNGCIIDNLAISFMPYVPESNRLELLHVGMQVDIRDTQNDVWKFGVIRAVKIVDHTKAMLNITIDGYPEDIYTWWPNSDVTYCSDVIIDRTDCEASSLSPTPPPGRYRVNFGVDEIDRYIHDKGEVFGTRGEPGKEQTYGWSVDNKDRVRKRTMNGNPLLDNMILFNPDPLSIWCSENKSTKPINCQFNEWSINVDNGYYDVYITMGDSEIAARYDLTVNKVDSVHRFLKENSFYTHHFRQVNAMQGKITITPGCPKYDECKYSWPRMSVVEIFRSKPEVHGEFNDEIKTKKLGCGIAFIGGKCSQLQGAENCIYDDYHDPDIKFCTGNLMITKIPKSYPCTEQRGKLKCIKSHFETKSECLLYCPGTCNYNHCVLSAHNSLF